MPAMTQVPLLPLIQTLAHMHMHTAPQDSYTSRACEHTTTPPCLPELHRLHACPPRPTRHASGLLNRAEWLKFAAAFFNKEPEANRVFEDIKSRFEAIVEKVAAVEKGTALPVVAFVTYSAYSGTYDGCPYGGYEVKVLEGYKEHLVTHGGGTSFDPALAAKWCSLANRSPGEGSCSSYLCPNAASLKEVSTQWSLRTPFCRSLGPHLPAPLYLRLPLLTSSSDHRPFTVPQVLKTIDVVIDETYSATPPSYTIDSFKANYGLTDETSADYPFLASSRVYKTDKRTSPANGSNDWMESSLPHADEALLDFAMAIVPQLKDETLTHAGESEVLADRPTRWLRDLATGEASAAVDPSECDDPNKLGSSLFAGRVCRESVTQMQATIAVLRAENDRLQTAGGTIKVVFT